MSYHTFGQYLQAGNILQSEQMLNSVIANCAPDMKKEKRAKLIKGLQKVKTNGLENNRKPKTTREMAVDLARRLMRG